MISGAIDAGQGWHDAYTGCSRARVLAVFRRAVYVEVNDAVLAFVAADVDAGPLHLRVAALPVVAVGDRIDIDSIVDDVPLWLPEPLDGEAVVATWSADRLTLADDAALHDDPSIAVARRSLVDGDLDAAVRTLSGLGPGLTPAGDDVLAGIALVRVLCGSPSGVSAAIEGACTHTIARAFLRWAARGQSIASLHLLLGALAANDTGAIADHQRRLAAIGATSGADLVLGVRLALECA